MEHTNKSLLLWTPEIEEEGFGGVRICEQTVRVVRTLVGRAGIASPITMQVQIPLLTRPAPVPNCARWHQCGRPTADILSYMYIGLGSDANWAM